jgi:hypothetical protein
MLNLILMTVLSLSTLIFLFLYVVQKRANKVIIEKTLETLLMQQLSKGTNKTDKDQANEDFLKFISDSRDWAYQYIEEVQTALKSFIGEVGPQIEYYDKYGAAVDGMVAPHDFALKKISMAYKELKKLLPEEYDGIK